MSTDRDRFLQDRTEYFQKADATRFVWMTQNPYFSRKEKELLRLLNQLRPARLLEIGCGEGGNLVNLENRPPLMVGIDVFETRCRFAREHCPGAILLCGDGSRLPVRSGAFDVVFCRDVLHHLPDQKGFIAEMARACRPSGHVVCIEACGRNPAILPLAVAIRAERGLLRSNPESLKSLLETAGLLDVRAEMHQPLPFYRIALHPRYGVPALGKRKCYAAWADWWERLFAKVVPQRWWAYCAVSGRKAS